MTPSWFCCVLSLGCAALLASCADAEPGDTPSESIIFQGEGPYPAIAEADFLLAFGRARTALLAKCCDYIDRNASRTDFGPPAPSRTSGAVYDAAAASACIAQYHALACPHGKEPPHAPASCQAAYRGGELQIDETCTTDWECQQNSEHTLICAATLSSEGLVRMCEPAAQALPRAGQLCHAADSSGLRCEPPMFCRDDGRCGLPQLGETCLVSSVFGDTCDKGFVCDRQGSQRCVEPKPVGSACESLNDCEMYACIDGVCVQPVWGLNGCTVH